jgi:hypothetical protein
MDTTSSSLVGNLILALAFISPVVGVAISVWAGRRKPPLAEELAAKYATKDELKAALDAMRHGCAEERVARALIYDRIENLRMEIESKLHSVGKDVQGIVHSVGRLEASVANLADRQKGPRG